MANLVQFLVSKSVTKGKILLPIACYQLWILYQTNGIMGLADLEQHKTKTTFIWESL